MRTENINLNNVAKKSDLETHVGNTSNPHAVTASQVGLGNVDNTSDANKPISIATQTALNGKASGTGTANGTNTGDETTNTIKTKLGTASGTTDGYLLQSDWNTFNGKQASLGFTPENVANKQNSLTVDGTGTKYPTVDAINSFGIVVDLIDALTVDFALSYAYKINSVTNITNAPTTTILDDGAAYTLTNTIAANSVMTITVDTASRIQLNVQKV